MRAIPGADARPGAVREAVGAQEASAALATARADAVDGRLVFVDNAIDATTGTIKAKAQFANAQHQLWPGQFVRVRLTLRTLAGAVVIPQAAVIQRGADHGVYVAGPDGRVRAGEGRTGLRITAAHRLRAVDGLLTGFHEPHASPLDLLSAFLEPDRLRRVYEDALREGYLWHEFGDANLIL